MNDSDDDGRRSAPRDPDDNNDGEPTHRWLLFSREARAWVAVFNDLLTAVAAVITPIVGALAWIFAR